MQAATQLEPSAISAGSRSQAGEWLVHSLILAAAVAVPLLGACMTTLSGEQVAFAGLERFPLPALCASRWLGVQCPTCGITRSVIALMHGNLQESLAFHRFGWMVLLFVAGQIPYRVLRLLRPHQRLPRLERFGIGMLLAIGVVVVLNRFFEVFVAA
jgi:hypothetical protein